MCLEPVRGNPCGSVPFMAAQKRATTNGKNGHARVNGHAAPRKIGIQRDTASRRDSARAHVLVTRNASSAGAPSRERLRSVKTHRLTVYTPYESLPDAQLQTC